MVSLFVFGRVLFGLYFVYSGFNHFKNEKMLVGYTMSKGVPYARFLVLLSGAMMMLGGLGFVFGQNLEQAIVLLLAFLVPTTFIMHAFWKGTDEMAKMNDHINFTKNMAIIATLLMMLA